MEIVVCECCGRFVKIYGNLMSFAKRMKSVLFHMTCTGLFSDHFSNRE